MSIFHLAQMEQQTRLRCCLHLSCRRFALLGVTWVCPSLTSMIVGARLPRKRVSIKKENTGHAGQQAQTMQGPAEQLPSDCQDGSLQ